MSDSSIRLFSLPSIPPRDADAHKGTFGKVVLVGGSVGMSGAVCLSALAALRSGSGLVTAAVPRSIQALVAGYEPSIMTIGLSDDMDSGLVRQSPEAVLSVCTGRDAIGLGPGLGRSAAASQLVRDLWDSTPCPLVIDADGLNAAAELKLFASRRDEPCIITPHPGEFSRLTGQPVNEIESHREEMARQFAEKCNVIVVLKGPGTIVTDGQRVFRNTTGNSGMATAGSGDVLTGIVTSLVGQRFPLFEAAVLAVHAHGLAGDLAAVRWTQRGMIASDLLKTLPDAWRKLENSSRTPNPR